MNNLIGQQWGSYRLTRLLGQGGFAEVYLAEHTRLKMFAAIKILYTHLSQEGVESFQNEAQVIANLVHPHIVRLLDFDVKEGRPFLVLDYASNGSLRQRYPKGTRLPLAQVVNYTQQVASALQFAHDQKLIHRDIKPENMLLGQQDTVLLGDFGIASIAHSTSSMNVQSSMGTIPYMAPEQIQGYPRPASDQYALGIVVYQWLSGDVPFQGNSSEIIAQHLGVEMPSIRKNIPEIPADVEFVLAMALAKDPKARFGSVQAFATALEQASKPPISQSFYAAQPQLEAQASKPTPTYSAPFAQTPEPNGLAPTVATGSSFAAQATVAPAPTPAQNPVYAGDIPLYPPFSSYPQVQADLPQPMRKAGSVAFKWGGIFGAIFILFIPINNFLLHLSPLMVDLRGGMFSYLVACVIYFCLGIVASRQTGKVATGVLASLWANLWTHLVVGILFVITYIQIASQYSTITGSLANSLAGSYVTGLLIELILGVGFGALGGLLGRSRAKDRQSGTGFFIR